MFLMLIYNERSTWPLTHKVPFNSSHQQEQHSVLHFLDFIYSLTMQYYCICKSTEFVCVNFFSVKLWTQFSSKKLSSIFGKIVVTKKNCILHYIIRQHWVFYSLFNVAILIHGCSFSLVLFPFYPPHYQKNVKYKIQKIDVLW